MESDFNCMLKYRGHISFMVQIRRQLEPNAFALSSPSFLHLLHRPCLLGQPQRLCVTIATCNGIMNIPGSAAGP
jgi:hypothetical protein